MNQDEVPAYPAVIQNRIQAPELRLLDHLDTGVCPIYVRRMPPCRNACPSSEDIRGHLTRISQSKLRGVELEDALDQAWHIIADKNPFPAVIGRICPHPCETACNRKRFDWPVAIHSMERFIGDRGIERGLKLERLAPPGAAGRKVAVVGAGPSGLSCAYQLARRGYDATVFEAAGRAGGMLAKTVPAYRLPPEILAVEIKKILDIGVELRLNERLGADLALEELRSAHDAVYLALGSHLSGSLDIAGEELAGVTNALDFLERVNAGAQGEAGAGKTTLVIGGGNAAIDAARVARRLGAEVTLAYRRSRFDMPAIPAEVAEAEQEGVRLELQCMPEAISQSASGALRVAMLRTEPGEPDTSGRRSPIPVAGSGFELQADLLITALGQRPDLTGLEMLAAEPSALPASPIKPTAIPGVFAGGDLLGPDFATTAIGQGRKAALAIHGHLNGREYREPHVPKPVEASELRLDYYLHLERNDAAELPAAERAANFDEVVLPFSEKEALAESRRCLSCGLCLLCDRCRIYCPREAISKDVSRPQGYNMFTDYTRCSGCTICSMTCPCHYIEMGFRG